MLKNVFKLLLLLSLGALVSCSSNNNASEDKLSEMTDIPTMFEKFSQEFELEAEVFLADSLHLLRPFRFKMLDDYMLVNDKDDTTFYSVYDMNTKAHLCRFLKKGRGPNEYLSPHASIYNEDTLMIVDDANTSRVTFFSKDKIRNCSPEPDRTIEIKKRKPGDVMTRVFPFNRTLIGTGQFETGRYYQYDMNGNITDYFGQYPAVDSKVSYDNYHLGFIYSGTESIRHNTAGTKLASLTGRSLSIFDYGDSQFTNVSNLVWYTPRIKEATYKDGRPYVLRIGNGAVVGAGSLAVTEDHLFFPFSKYEFREIVLKGFSDYYGYIFVADWEGNPVVRLKLDKRIQFPMELDKEGNYLYSTHISTETGLSQIIRYDVSFLKNVVNN